jgi:hypothetical protein
MLSIYPKVIRNLKSNPISGPQKEENAYQNRNQAYPI